MKYLMFLLFASTLIFSCKKSSSSCDENKVCYTQKPDSLYIELQLSPTLDDSPIEVKFFVGNSDDGELYHSFTTYNELEYFLMPVGEKYAAEAYYTEGDVTTVAVDGERLEADYFMNCDVQCYEWEKDLILDLKLK
ncbi:MAG: hypothetical protein WED10_03465 [Brumimicrobium sp.]